MILNQAKEVFSLRAAFILIWADNRWMPVKKWFKFLADNHKQ